MEIDNEADAQPEKRSDTVLDQSERPSKLRGLIPFKKGDSRINRKGRPKDFDKLRELVKSIGHEAHPSGEGDTVVSEKIRRMYASDNPRDSEIILAYGWGKVKDEVDVTSGGEKLQPELMRPSEIAASVAAIMATVKHDDPGAENTDAP